MSLCNFWEAEDSPILKTALQSSFKLHHYSRIIVCHALFNLHFISKDIAAEALPDHIPMPVPHMASSYF